MERVAKSVAHLAKHVLPTQPHYLSIDTTRTYRIDPDEKRLDEQDIRALQYTTLIGGEADRGVLVTRGYFTVREEPNAHKAPTMASLKVDPNKPRKKVSLKDYKSKKLEGESPPKSEERDKPNGLSTIKEEGEVKDQIDQTSKDLEGRSDVKRPVATSKAGASRPRSPSPERRKRPVDTDEAVKPIKRVKADNATSNGTAPRLSKDSTPQNPTKAIPPTKTEVKDVKPSVAANGKPALRPSGLFRSASPKTNSQVNGLAKANSNGQSMHKRAVSNGEPVSKAVPKLLSPLTFDSLGIENSSDKVDEAPPDPRPSPKKRPAEGNNLKPQPKKMKDDREPSPSTKKRRTLPPLLSPTLPPVVMDELARIEKKLGTPSKETGQRDSQGSDSSLPVKKPSKEEQIQVAPKKEEPARCMVVMKYKRKHAKTIERLLNLPSGQRKKTEALKRDSGPRESSGSVEPGIARKRPPTTTVAGTAMKRPQTSDSLRPSTPPKQSVPMSRIASNSSQVGTPSVANGLTPSAQGPPERRREPIAPERLQRAQKLYAAHRHFMELGTKMKHKRDGIMKNPRGYSDAERQVAITAGVQSLLLYMHAIKLQSDASDLEGMPRRVEAWREVVPLFRVIRIDSSKHVQVSALLLRIQGIFMSYMGRSLWFLPPKPEVAETLVSVNKEEVDIWRSAEQARRKLDACDTESDQSHGAAVGKLIDRLGPWTTPEDAIPISLEVLRRSVRLEGPFKPVEDLAKIGRSMVNGI
ncbi:hypothetical protein F5Y17DRAFT_123722 [Xylariaceae sp. FL0594]|nr:hypothetical protein F5Y17DRAFT_123722 [Xylariaceae sp. FL0594]